MRTDALWRSTLLLFSFAASSVVVAERKPIHVPTDGAKWFGNDGKWSTGTLRLGDPAQFVYVIAGTSSSFTAVVDAVWCGDDQLSGYTCDERGRAFTRAASTSWKEIGQYELNIRPELMEDKKNMMYRVQDYGFGRFGRDTIKIKDVDETYEFKDQIIAVMNDSTRLVGSLGLGVDSRNFLGEEAYPSLMSRLYDGGTIPSRSYGYTAGNYYKPYKMPMDLVLGGKNAGRYRENDVTFKLDANKNPVVTLRSVSASATGNPPWGPGPQPLLPEPVSAIIDSSTPFIWLPEEACRQFESALKLTWNETLQLYLFNDTSTRDQLIAPNITFKFSLAPSPDSKTIDIDVSYSSFDLDIGWPYINLTLPSTQKYFPLKRTGSDQAITLGRTFLQEAYLIVDYERGNFSVYPTVSPPQQHNIIPIIHPKDVKNVASPGSSSNKTAIIGAAVGGTVGALILIAIVVFFLRRRRRLGRGAADDKPPLEEDPNFHPGISEAYGDSVRPASKDRPFSEAYSANATTIVEEMGDETMLHELPAVNVNPAELMGSEAFGMQYARTPTGSLMRSTPAPREDDKESQTWPGPSRRPKSRSPSGTPSRNSANTESHTLPSPLRTEWSPVSPASPESTR